MKREPEEGAKYIHTDNCTIMEVISYEPIKQMVTYRMNGQQYTKKLPYFAKTVAKYEKKK